MVAIVDLEKRADWLTCLPFLMFLVFLGVLNKTKSCVRRGKRMREDTVFMHCQIFENK
jgi:hypothetical protein